MGGTCDNPSCPTMKRSLLALASSSSSSSAASSNNCCASSLSKLHTYTINQQGVCSISFRMVAGRGSLSLSRDITISTPLVDAIKTDLWTGQVNLRPLAVSCESLCNGQLSLLWYWCSHPLVFTLTRALAGADLCTTALCLGKRTAADGR